MKLTEQNNEFQRTFGRRFNLITTIVLLYTVGSGAIRKWGVDSSAVANAVLAIQLVMPFLYFFLPRSPAETFPKWWPYFVLLLMVGLFNFHQKTYFHGIFGFILYMGFPFLIIKYFENREHINLKPLLWLLFTLAGIEFGLGLIQYFLPGNSVFNKYAIESDQLGRAFVGDKVRVTGTFSYLGGYGSFVVFLSMAVWSQLIEKRALPVIIPIAIMGLGCALFSGSRGAFINFLFFTGLGLLHYVQSIANLVRLAVTGTIIFIILVSFNVGGLSEIFVEGYDNILIRFGEGDIEDSDLRQRSLNPLTQVFYFDLPYNKFLGIGTGATYQGANAIWGTSEAVMNAGFYEDEIQRVLIEGGYLMYFFRFLIMYYCVDRLTMPGLWKFFAFCYLFFFGNVIFNIYGTIFTAVGLIFVDNAYYRRRMQDQEEGIPETKVVRDKKELFGKFAGS